jgi:RHS repeat-associated protein
VDSNRGYASVLAQLDGSSGALQATYTLGNGTDRVTQATSGGFRFYLQDAHGNVRTLVDGNASPTQTYAYDAFGNALVTQVNANEAANDFRYTGEQLDGETGTYYLRARNYDPAVGRFTQWDTWEGVDSDSLNLNHYIYGKSAPSMLVDSSGHVPFSPSNGYEIEAIVCDEYIASHPGEVDCGAHQVFGDDGAYLKPDIFDNTRKKYAEVKPLSVSGIGKGIAQMRRYDIAFGEGTEYSYSREEIWTPPPAFVATLGGNAVWFLNVEGIIFYSDVESIASTLAASSVSLSGLRVALRGQIRAAALRGAFSNVTADAFIDSNIGAALAASESEVIVGSEIPFPVGF